MYIYHALVDALSTHTVQINLNTVLYAYAEHSPSNAIYIKYYVKHIRK